MFRARHHCRSCGLLTCDDCSPYTAFLPQLGWGNEQPQRVCRLCSGKSLAVVEVEMDAYVLCSRTDANRADIAQLEQLASAVRTAKSYPTFNVFLFRLLVATLTSVFSQVHHRMQETLHWVTTSSHVDSAALRDCISNADRLRAIHARTGAYVGKIDLAPLEKHAQRVKGKLAHRLAPVRIRASTMRPPCIRPQRSLKNTAPKHVRFSIAKPPPSPIELDLRDARTCSTTLLRSEPPLRVVTH